MLLGVRGDLQLLPAKSLLWLMTSGWALGLFAAVTVSVWRVALKLAMLLLSRLLLLAGRSLFADALRWLPLLPDTGIERIIICWLTGLLPSSPPVSGPAFEVVLNRRCGVTPLPTTLLPELLLGAPVLGVLTRPERLPLLLVGVLL